MKTILDYLKEHERYEQHNFSLELKENDNVLLKFNEKEWLVKERSGYYIEQEIAYILEAHKIEIRFCEFCGKPMDCGYTVDNGGWYSCEECFDWAMNKDYGKGNWRASNQAGEYGGYYEYLKNGMWEDTGIYYTEWF